MIKKLAMLLAVALFWGVAEAHSLNSPATGFMQGFGHPLAGLDHLLAMLAAGIWAGQQGGRMRWSAPAAFAIAMTIGALLGMAALPVPLVEPGILGSVLVLGTLAALGARLPAPVGIAAISLFALLHGHAHGSEIPASASALSYCIGFVVATLLLLGAGLLTGSIARRPFFSQLLRSDSAVQVVNHRC